MTGSSVYLHLAVMAGVTYLVRMLPLVFLRREVKQPFVRSFLHYVPYVTLSVMTFPAILHATESVASATVGFVVALALAYCGRSLITVALAASVAVYLAERLMPLLLN